MKHKNIVIAALMMPAICLAKRDVESTMPYIQRYGISLIVNGPPMILILAAIYIVYRYIAKISVENFVKNAIIGILIASLLPLIDTLNDEGYDPAWIGGISAALALPIIAFVNSKGMREIIRTAIPIVLFLPLVPTMMYLTINFQNFLSKHLFEASW